MSASSNSYDGHAVDLTGKSRNYRIDSIDLVRGIVMVVMMLDHTRDFVHNAFYQFDPLDPTRTNLALFFTRWITHFCAPAFVFLAGTSIYLQFARGKSKNELTRFLLTRGLWLIFLELTIVRLTVFFSFDYRLLFFLQVIWVIGVSMMVMAALIHLPVWLIGVFGVALIAGHNLLDRIHVTSWQGPGTAVPSLADRLWMLLHQQGGTPIAGDNTPVVFIIYPLIPWIGVMAAGYAFGTLYKKTVAERKRLLVIIGVSAVLLFLIVRATNFYGDPNVWSTQSRGFVYTVLSFLNTQKYPPSLLYLLMTLGPTILALAFFETNNPSSPGVVRQFFVTFGRVPLFFYLLQWPTAHLISIALHFAFGKPTAWLFQTPMSWTSLEGVGFSLGVVYLAWIAGVLLLYPLCKWFAGVKARRKDWWLSYL